MGEDSDTLHAVIRAFSLTLALLLVSCGGENSAEDMTALYGPMSATGTIKAAEASLHRRGTHMLMMNGSDRFFLESKSVNLSEFEGTLAVVQGELSANTHKDFLPVLTVSSARTIEENVSDSSLEEITINALGLTLSAPHMWVSAEEDGAMTFSHPDEDQPFMRIEKSTGQSLPEGLPIRIAGKNGTRAVDEGTGVHYVLVERSEHDQLLFTFAPKGEESKALRDAFYTMLRTVEFGEAEVSERTEGAEGELEGSGQPCGGPANVICPEGEFCEVREIDTGIGVCRTLANSD